MASWFSFYNFTNEVLGIKFRCQKKYDWFQKTSEMGLIYPLENICVICDRPSEIHIENGRFHNETGMSIKYTDGWGCYSLNGIPMKEEYVLTPPDKIKIDTVINEENIDARRELIRKVGVDKLAGSGTIVDEGGFYKLIDMSKVIQIDKALYLLMKNPSVKDTFHLEGVSNECKTVSDALHYRKPEELKKIPISESGESWFQQGDVCIWPKNATMIKEMPTILT